MELNNKLAIVTGASKGIGKATVELLLASGCKVAGWSRSPLKIDNPNFHFFSVDVSDEASVNKGYEHTLAHFGDDVEILINNAGVGFYGSIMEVTSEEWQTTFKTNVDSILYCSRLVIPKMQELDNGHIVNIASIAGSTGIQGMAAYCGSKFAVRGISQAMYKELRNDGIKVTCINPGSVQTNFFDNIQGFPASQNMMQAEDIADSIIHVLNSSANYHPVELEIRPLKPKG